MKKFEAVNKRNQRAFVLTFMEDGKVLAFDKEKNSEKEISAATVKRWFTVGEEIVEVVVESKVEKKERQHSRSEVKKDGTVRKDKFRPKLTAENAMEILDAFHKGEKKSHLAKMYEVSFRTITCIVEGLMWKDVFAKFHSVKSA